MNDRETRCYSGEVRAEQYDNAPTHILGYGSVFNSRSEPLWGFREIIKPGAFDDVLNDDVRGLFNHDPNFILGRSSAARCHYQWMNVVCVTTLLHRIRRRFVTWCCHQCCVVTLISPRSRFASLVMERAGMKTTRGLLSGKSRAFLVCMTSAR